MTATTADRRKCRRKWLQIRQNIRLHLILCLLLADHTPLLHLILYCAYFWQTIHHYCTSSYTVLTFGSLCTIAALHLILCLLFAAYAPLLHFILYCACFWQLMHHYCDCLLRPETMITTSIWTIRRVCVTCLISPVWICLSLDPWRLHSQGNTSLLRSDVVMTCMYWVGIAFTLRFCWRRELGSSSVASTWEEAMAS